MNPKDLIGSVKVDLTKFPAVGLAHGAHAMMDGAEKYGGYNWRDHAVQAHVYVAAASRHLLSWFEGEECASDSGVHHLGHAMACCAILLDAQANDKLVDDRPVCDNPTLMTDTLASLADKLKEKRAAKDQQPIKDAVEMIWKAPSITAIDPSKNWSASSIIGWDNPWKPLDVAGWYLNETVAKRYFKPTEKNGGNSTCLYRVLDGDKSSLVDSRTFELLESVFDRKGLLWMVDEGFYVEITEAEAKELEHPKRYFKPNGFHSIAYRVVDGYETWYWDRSTLAKRDTIFEAHEVPKLVTDGMYTEITAAEAKELETVYLVNKTGAFSGHDTNDVGYLKVVDGQVHTISKGGLDVGAGGWTLRNLRRNVKNGSYKFISEADAGELVTRYFRVDGSGAHNFIALTPDQQIHVVSHLGCDHGQMYWESVEDLMNSHFAKNELTALEAAARLGDKLPTLEVK